MWRAALRRRQNRFRQSETLQISFQALENNISVGAADFQCLETTVDIKAAEAYNPRSLQSAFARHLLFLHRPHGLDF